MEKSAKNVKIVAVVLFVFGVVMTAIGVGFCVRGYFTGVKVDYLSQLTNIAVGLCLAAVGNLIFRQVSKDRANIANKSDAKNV